MCATPALSRQDRELVDACQSVARRLQDMMIGRRVHDGQGPGTITGIREGITGMVAVVDFDGYGEFDVLLSKLSVA